MKLRKTLVAAAVVAAGGTANADRTKCDEAKVVATLDKAADERMDLATSILQTMKPSCVALGLANELANNHSWRAVIAVRSLGFRDDKKIFAGLIATLVSQTLDSGQHDVVEAIRERLGVGPWAVAKLGELLVMKKAEGQARVIAIELLAEAGPDAVSEVGRLAVVGHSDQDEHTRETAKTVLAKILAENASTIVVNRNRKVPR